MPKTNENKLVMLALQGKVAHADEFLPFEVSHRGQPYALPGTGSITYNVKVGDLAFGWVSDHTEPGVSTTCISDEKQFLRGYNFLPCIGNEAVVVTGDAKGARGIVTGKHGGVEHVLVDFSDDVLQKLNLEDKFLIRAIGQGLNLSDYPDVLTYSLSPTLLKKLNVKEGKNGVLEVGVTTIVPASIMGSGIGSIAPTRGDYDITTQDETAVKEFGLDKIRLGDLIGILDADSSYGRCYRKGAITIAVVAHANSFVAGHGPGVTTLLTSAKPKIKPFIDPHANIAEMLKIGKFRK